MALPRTPLGTLPTPLHRVDTLSPHPEVQLWCKREDRAGTVYGGNKVRKLEVILAEAHRTGATDVLTVGAVGSHHLVAAALYGTEAGVRVHAVCFPQPDTPHARQHARLAHAQLASARLVRRRTSIPGAVIVAHTALWHTHGRAPLWVPPGGSNTLGAAASASLGTELAQAVVGGELPGLDQVFLPLGSGGTAAGLAAGLGMAGCTAEVVAVNVVDGLPGAGWWTRRLARAAMARLGHRGTPAPIRVLEDHIGPGYGHPTPEGQAATQRAAAVGLDLDPTYTAKALAACLSEISQRRTGPHVVFLNTVNSRPLDAQLAQAPPLPDAWEALLS